MKTTVFMERAVYKGLNVRQDSKSGMINATDLLRAYNKVDNALFGNPVKDLSVYKENVSTNEFIQEIMRRENLTLGQVITSKKGRYGGTHMHPMLFLDFAMWLSPEFKYTVLKWIQDGLVRFRNDSGDSFKEVSAHLSSTFGLSCAYEYKRFCKKIYTAVLPAELHRKSDKWQHATEEQLELRDRIHKTAVQFCKTGKFTNPFELIEIAIDVNLS